MLRLFQQAFRLHCGLDTVEHDTNAGRQLFKERQLGGSEGAQRCQFDHRLYPIFKQNGQHDHISRYGLEQAGADGDGVRRQIGDQHSPLFRRTLSDQTLSNLQTPQMSDFSIACKSRQQNHLRRFVAFHLVDHALLRVDQGS